MKKHSIFLTISISAFLMTFVSPVCLGVFFKNDDIDVLMWKSFSLFSAISVVSFLIWITLLIINKTKATDIISESIYKKHLCFITIVMIFILVLIISNL